MFNYFFLFLNFLKFVKIKLKIIFYPAFLKKYFKFKNFVNFFLFFKNSIQIIMIIIKIIPRNKNAIIIIETSQNENKSCTHEIKLRDAINGIISIILYRFSIIFAAWKKDEHFCVSQVCMYKYARDCDTDFFQGNLKAMQEWRKL